MALLDSSLLWMASSLLFFFLLPCLISSGPEVVSGLFQLSQQNSLSSSFQESGGYNYQQCYHIPSNMTLCQQVGYGQMILPNFLQHESLREAIQHSNFWVVLVNTNCHADLRRFLCSLYAPVCVKGHQEVMVMPCHNLCFTVKKACLPRMMSFGYQWPAILDCEQFPKESHMCIPLSSAQADMAKCDVCEKSPTHESVVSSSCLADIVMKVKIRAVKAYLDEYEIFTGGERKLFKGQPKLRSLVNSNSLSLRASCVCEPGFGDGPTQYRQGRWLLMGEVTTDGYIKVTFMTPWKRDDKLFRQYARAMRKGKKICMKESFALNDDGRAEMNFLADDRAFTSTNADKNNPAVYDNQRNRQPAPQQQFNTESPFGQQSSSNGKRGKGKKKNKEKNMNWRGENEKIVNNQPYPIDNKFYPSYP